MPLDINNFRADRDGDVEKLRKSQKARFAPEKIIDDVIAKDKEWREIQFKVEGLRASVGKKSKEVAEKKKAGQPADDITAEIRKIKEQIEVDEKVAEKVLKERDVMVSTVGNIVHESVPVFKDEAENKIERKWGICRRSPEMKHHNQLLYMIGGYEPEAGVTVAGHRGYFLTGPCVLLSQAIVTYGLHFLTEHGYTALQPPYFMNRDVMAATAQLSDFDDQLYKVSGEGDDKYLIATSEQPISAFHRFQWLAPQQLPIRYVGYSACFRKEAGSHKDSLGIFRTHQFDKLEQFCITDPESSWAEHERMIKISEEFFQSLGIAYRVVNIVSGELNNAAAKKYDLEGWFPAFGEYRELVSCSNCTDYQSRAMETRFGQKKAGDKEKKYVHMLNSTLCAVGRAICCIAENYQTKDGIVVPPALVPYMKGIKFIPFIQAPLEDENAVRLQREKELKFAAAKAGHAAEEHKDEVKEEHKKEKKDNGAVKPPAKPEEFFVNAVCPECNKKTTFFWANPCRVCACGHKF